MCRLFALVFGVALVASPAWAQDQGWAAKFFKEGLKHDFGNVPWGAQLTHKFTITNIYNVPFMVDQASVSCGCVSLKRPATIIPPRGTEELEAYMDTRKVLPNGQIKAVNIYVRLTSVPQAGEKVFSSSCTLVVSCVAKADLRFSSDKIVFGAVALGQTPSRVLDVEHFTQPGFEITEVAPHNHPVRVDFQKVQPRMGGRSAYQVTATLKSDAPAGELKYEILLKTNDPATPVIMVVMEGMIQAPLVAVPNTFDLGNVKLNEIVSRHVILTGPAGRPFKIVKVEGEGDGVRLKPPDKPGGPLLLKIEFVPTKAGKVSRTLHLKTDLPGDLSATVVVDGSGIP
jgi:hypothetical protein